MTRVAPHLAALLGLGLLMLSSIACTPGPGVSPPADGDPSETVTGEDPARVVYAGKVAVPPAAGAEQFAVMVARAVPAGKAAVLATVESVEIYVVESDPPQYFVEVVSGLRKSCAEYHGYEESRSGTAIVITVTNLEPSPSQQVACAERYRTHLVSIPLGADFDRGKMYTVKVNEVTETFVAGGEPANGESSGRVAPTLSEEPTLVSVVTVGPARVECQGTFPWECLLVDGEYFFEEIEGFEHEPG